MRAIPWLFIYSRFLLAPLIVYLGIAGLPNVGSLVVVLIWVALIGDILDGIIARKVGNATPFMRRMDSIADLTFWLGVGTATWFWNPDIYGPYLFWLRLALVSEALTYVVSFMKFGKELAAHAYSGKLLGIAILLGFTGIWWTGSGTVWVPIMLGFAYLSHLDRFGIAFLLPRWTPDTPSAYHANRIRKGLPIKKHSLFHGD